MHIDNIVHSGQYEIGDSLEMFCYCQLKLQLQPDSEMKIYCHYRRAYFHVSDINHDGDTDSQTQTVKGTLCFHSVHNTGIPGIIEVHESSCYCEPRFLSMPGECKNWRLVNNLHGLLCTKSAIYLAMSKTNFGMDCHCLTNQLEQY